MRDTHAVLVVGLLAALLAGCGSSNDPQRFPGLPVDNLLDTAQQPAFRTADPGSFARAVLQVPASGGSHTVPIGEYLLSRLVESFPRGTEVDNLRLVSFDSECRDAGWISSSLVCTVATDISFRVNKRANLIAVRLDERDFGGLQEPKQAGYVVTRPDAATKDGFERQVRAVPDAIAARFKRDLQPILVEAQRRQIF